MSDEPKPEWTFDPESGMFWQRPEYTPRFHVDLSAEANIQAALAFWKRPYKPGWSAFQADYGRYINDPEVARARIEYLGRPDGAPMERMPHNLVNVHYDEVEPYREWQLSGVVFYQSVTEWWPTPRPFSRRWWKRLGRTMRSCVVESFRRACDRTL